LAKLYHQYQGGFFDNKAAYLAAVEKVIEQAKK
jgi:hypothetical protein